MSFAVTVEEQYGAHKLRKERKHTKKVVYLVIVDGEIDSAYDDRSSAEDRRDEMLADDLNYVTGEYELDSGDDRYSEEAAYMAGYDGDNTYVARIAFDPSDLDKTYRTDEGDEIDGYQISAAIDNMSFDDEDEDEDGGYDDYD